MRAHATGQTRRPADARPRRDEPNVPLVTIARRLLELDQTKWEAIRVFREEYARAAAAGDGPAQELLASYAAEALDERAGGPLVSAEEALARLEAIPGVRASARRVQRAEQAFFDRYFAAKARSPYKTQRAVARAARISPVTVQAIESRRIKPHFKTIEKLAGAFAVPVADLLGGA